MKTKIAWIAQTIAKWLLLHFPVDHLKPTDSEIRRAAWQILATIHPADDEIDIAIQGAFSKCGLNLSDYSQDFDLIHTGKLHEIIVHTTRQLGNPLITVADLRNLLK